VVQVRAQHHSQHDYPIIQRLYQCLQQAGVPAQLIDADLSPQALSYLYSQCDVVLATRLHSIILAACGGTPSVAIRYQGFKTQGIMDGLGLAGLTHDINTVESSGLLNSLADVLKRRDILTVALEQRVAVCRQEIGTVAQSLLGGLKHND
jgi:polysaccharide pyruvyl transferase WcaK-like protein